MTRAEKMFNVLKRQASKYKPIYYSDLYKEMGLDRNSPADLRTGSNLLEETNLLSGKNLMISSFAVSKSGNGPYDGFYKLAEQWGRIEAGLSEIEKEKFWIDEMKMVYEKYRIGRS